MKAFTEEQLDEAEAVLKREEPELWLRLTKPTMRGGFDTGFAHRFLQATKRLSFMRDLNDATALSYELYGRAAAQVAGAVR